MALTPEKLLNDPKFVTMLADELEKTVQRDTLAANPYQLLDSGALCIQDKQAQLIPLKLNACQQKIWTIIQGLLASGQPIRLLILKCRQSGVSTFIESLIFCRTSTQANRHALILADEEKKSSHLYDMTKRYQEHLERTQPALAPALERCNEKALKFAGRDSQIMIGSAENPKMARSFTWQDAHLSEVAYYPPNRVAELFDGFWPSMAKGPHTMVVLETTANGHDPVFYPLWTAAIAKQNDFTPIFIPWFWVEEYQRPYLPGGPESDVNTFLDQRYPLDGVSFDTDGGLEDFLQEEIWLVKTFELTQAQLEWRRWAIVNECRGEVSVFRQEYPATWQEAFQVSGSCIFRTATLRAEQASAEQSPPTIGRLVEFGDRVEFREDPAGWLRLYEPARGQQVRIGGDTCEGLPWGEEAALVAGDALTRDVLAVVSKPYPPDTLARYAMLLGRYYTHPVLKDPLIAIEANGYGHTANQTLRKLYGNVYSTTQVDEDTKQEVQRFGFLTTGASRDRLIELGKARIREHACQLRDQPLIGQLTTFVRDLKTGKVGHAHGAFDDLVIAWLIMLWLCETHPAESEFTLEERAHGGSYVGVTESLPANSGYGFE